MRTDVKIREVLIDSLAHLCRVTAELRAQSGKGKLFSFPDAHKLSEGLFLRAWTEWETFIRELLIADLAGDPQSILRIDVKAFRTKGTPGRLAERLLAHPDAPEQFVEWNYPEVRSRAEAFLSSAHRYPATLKTNQDLERLKRLRNAVAHGSDKAWTSFLKLTLESLFRLTGNQRSGITPGRFFFSHKWNHAFVLEGAYCVIASSALELAPA